MGTIFVGGHLLGSSAGMPSAAQDFGHLFLLYSEDGIVSNDDTVIRGGPSGRLRMLGEHHTGGESRL